ncbi:DUF1588 domain-containing protein [Lignipirellula cremea]|uniref:Planctomycete cytochrome C n=1 Tax=Lignipirellula cremea TaxID=2528010 RepID=A0A518DKF8_9BACT|nr:DUF1588 domain-containing protein [Lignipirellula cremea]QDU92322.1 Planctomycete cytochrome C [Lignipirellula cremea]
MTQILKTRNFDGTFGSWGFALVVVELGFRTLCFCLGLLAGVTTLYADYQQAVRPLFQSHCIVCHGPAKQESDLRLDKLTGDLSAHPDEADIWSAILEQLETGAMPPGKRTRPKPEEIAQATAWIRRNVGQAEVALERRMRFPENGNRVPHEVLFDPETARRAPKIAASPARFWRVTPETYEARQLAWHNAFGGSPDPQVGSNAAPFGLYVKNELKNYSSLFVLESAESEGLINNALAMMKRVVSDTKHPRSLIAKMIRSETEVNDENLQEVLTIAYAIWLRRPPTADELTAKTSHLRAMIKRHGLQGGLMYGLVPIIADPEAAFAIELGRVEPGSEPVMLTPLELADALERAIVDRQDRRQSFGPFHRLAVDGKLSSRGEVRAALQKIKLNTSQTTLRFFAEFFMYPHSEGVFKCPKDILHQQRELQNPYFEGWRSGKDAAMPNVTGGADELIREVLEEDRQVLREILVRPLAYPGKPYKTWRRQLEYGVAKRDESYARVEKELAEVRAAGDEKKIEQLEKELKRLHNHEYQALQDRLKWLEKPDLPDRIGILNQRAWLVANSTNVTNHPIHRGKWIRERLLAQRIPEVPAGVDAVLPDDPDRTLRQRMEKTRQAECWQCHQLMDPLGLPFERYDHFGSWRKTELEKPVDVTGEIVNSGDPAIDGPVAGPDELVRRLAASPRVEQSFVRHAFRFWMGRNETLDDARTIQHAHQAYQESDGSMSALVESLLLSDAFLYRQGALPEEVSSHEP